LFYGKTHVVVNIRIFPFFLLRFLSRAFLHIALLHFPLHRTFPCSCIILPRTHFRIFPYYTFPSYALPPVSPLRCPFHAIPHFPLVHFNSRTHFPIFPYHTLPSYALPNVP
jgi:hypothetical protein